MRKPELEQLQRTAVHLRKHLSLSSYRRVPVERAFISWYVQARFGAVPDATIVDGESDGGIDAIFHNRRHWTVLQSKYEKSAKVQTVKRDEVSAFEQLAALFADGSREDEFRDWLGTVRGELRPKYEQLRRATLRAPSDTRFIFLTTKRFELGESELVTVEDIHRIAALWHLYSEGFTPPTESITLRLESSWETPSADNGFMTLVGLTDVAAFLALMEDEDNEALFAQNVRTDLRSQINKGIQRTYEQTPDTFWLGNNGLYIVCKDIDKRHGQYKLLFPSIINGSQTLHSIRHSKVRHPCNILVRILEMDAQGNPTLLSSVIRRTNTQNPMKLVNLSAHDPLQLNLARFLDRFHIFYERREKEWANEKKGRLADYVPLNVKDMAQWLSTLHPIIGFGEARSNVSALFQTEHYKRIFEGFDASFTSPDYSAVPLVTWSGFLAKNLPRNLPSRARSRARIARLLLVRATYDAVRGSVLLRAEIPHLLDQHRFGRTAIPGAALVQYKEMLSIFARLQKIEERNDPGKDFSNFFKSDSLTRKAYRRGCSARRIRALRRALEQGLSRVH